MSPPVVVPSLLVWVEELHENVSVTGEYRRDKEGRTRQVSQHKLMELCTANMTTYWSESILRVF